MKMAVSIFLKAGFALFLIFAGGCSSINIGGSGGLGGVSGSGGISIPIPGR